MGNDVADLNHDGWPDIISLDMLPEDEKVLKSSEGDDNVQIQKLRIEQYGYHYQFTRNMLYMNQPESTFSETALMTGIAATDWSWSALFADYDQDGEQDLFVSNGILKRPNDLDFINFASNEQIQKKINNTKLVDQQALDMMPSGAVHNYIFQGSEFLNFKDQSSKWITKDTLISGATALADLDLDGDLDLVTNNCNATASLYINKTDDNANFLKVKFRYKESNPFGIGTKVLAYHKGKLQYKELYTVRGFQASSEPVIHFGYGETQTVDSLRIIWPDKSSQLVKSIATNQTLTISPQSHRPFDYNSLRPEYNQIFQAVEGNLGIDYTHQEDPYLDFNRQKLIPYRLSDRGPATAIGDLNEDGLEDIFFGGSKFISSAVFFASDSTYVKKNIVAIATDSIKEDVCALIEDFDGNGQNDLFIGSGGADFFDQMQPLHDSYFVKKDSVFVQGELPDYYSNSSVARPYDFDADGDIDLFVGNQVITNDFGNTPASYLLENKNGAFQ